MIFWKATKWVALSSLVISALVYIALFLGNLGNAQHQQVARETGLARVYSELCRYRARRGHWPKTLLELTSQEEALLTQGDLLDPISHRPLIYCPDTQPGTQATLLAQPDPTQVGLWPFMTTWRNGIRANGAPCHYSCDDINGCEEK